MANESKAIYEKVVLPYLTKKCRQAVDSEEKCEKSLSDKVRNLAVCAMDAKDASGKPKTPISDCTAKGGPEHCPYHSKFIHKEGEGVSGYYNQRKVVNIQGKEVYIDTGAAENKKFLSEKMKKDGVRSDPEFGRRIYTDGKEHPRKAPKKMHTKYILLPEKNAPAETPTLDTFKTVKPDDRVYITKFKRSELYSRSAKPRFGIEKKNDKKIAKKVEGQSLYTWTLNGKELSNEEAMRLETALSEMKMTPILSPNSSDAVVRPDFATCFGDLMDFKDGKGNTKRPKSKDYQEILDKIKNERISALYSHYDDIVHKIMEDAQKGKKEAILAYFMYRTKIRVGSKQNPTKSDGRGATTLYTGDFTVDGDKVGISFPAKNGWWHLQVEDKFLADFCKKRKAELQKMGEGRNSTPFFNCNYKEINNYLKDISQEYVGGNRELAFRPHNFRHFAATRIVEQKIAELAKGITHESNREKYETAVCKGITAAAAVLNDAPDVVFEKYVIPQIAFSGNKKFIEDNFKFMLANSKDPRVREEEEDVNDSEED